MDSGFSRLARWYSRSRVSCCLCDWVGTYYQNWLPVFLFLVCLSARLAACSAGRGVISSSRAIACLVMPCSGDHLVLVLGCSGLRTGGGARRVRTKAYSAATCGAPANNLKFPEKSVRTQSRSPAYGHDKNLTPVVVFFRGAFIFCWVAVP